MTDDAKPGPPADGAQPADDAQPAPPAPGDARPTRVSEPSSPHSAGHAAAVALDDDGWPLGAPEAPDAIAPDAVLPAPPATPPPASVTAQMPTAANAAYEAARIVGEMVGDIESAPGAALVAAAAAGAAIEVARARIASGESERLPPPPLSAADAASMNPAITARLNRERILRAFAEDIAANATSTATAEASAASAAASAASAAAATAPPPASPAIPATGRGIPANPTTRVEPLRPPGRLATQPPRTDELPVEDGEDEVDPVAIAAAAIARLRARARTDLAELRVHYHRHDILVVLAAFVIILIAGRIHEGLVTPPTEPFDPGGGHGLTFQHPRGWLTQVGGALPSPRIAHEVGPGTSPAAGKPADALYHVELTSTRAPTARIEVLIDKKPAWSNIVTGLDLDRRTRWGELYALDDSSVRSVEDHQWLRTAYRFAHAPEKGDVPRIDHAVEYATIDREQIYVLTFFGTPPEIERIEDVVAPSLRVATQTGLPLVPQTGHLSTRKYPNAVSRAFESTVMVVVADVIDGRLHARGGGSGVIVGKDGSILTNFHVIHDQRGRLHDVFVIGRFSEQDKAPQLFCAGKPSRGKLQRDLDLALLKCDLDLDGRTWSPKAAGAAWKTLPLARATDAKMGQRIWVLGYPDVGGGGLTLGEGEIEGWTGFDDRGVAPGGSAAGGRSGSIDDRGVAPGGSAAGGRSGSIDDRGVAPGGSAAGGRSGSIDDRGVAPGGSAAGGRSGSGMAPGGSAADGAAGKDFLKTDAAIRHGNSGGPVVDDAGHLVGIASAVRVKQNAAGEVVEVVQAGGRIRPIAAASDLLAIATTGWTPREGHTDVELEPTAIEAPAEGVQIQSRVVDAANEAPVRDALVMVLRPGVDASAIDVNRLDDQVLSYGRSNAQGEVSLKQPVPVPGSYTLLVIARGYEPMIGENALVLSATTPEVFDPWGKLPLRGR